MLHALLALVVTFQAQTPAGAGAPSPDSVVADAYLDEKARALIQQARERRELVDRSIASYEVLVRERFSTALRTSRFDRLAYREEAVARVTWNRDGASKIEMLGARAAAPILTDEVTAAPVPLRFVFDPVDDGLVAGLGGRDFLRHPLDPDAEANYRYRSGDSTSIDLGGGRVLRVHEVVLLPRRNDPRLIGGSIWIDQDSHAIVQALVRPVRPFDLRGEARAEGETRSVGVDLTFEGEIEQIWVEYGWWDRRWWLPAIVVFEGEARIGNLVGVPMRVERRYEDYTVVVDPSPPPPVARIGGNVVRLPLACERGTENCRCQGRRCRLIEVVTPEDRDSLIYSAYFEGSIHDGSSPLITEEQLERIGAGIERIAGAPWQITRPGLSWDFGSAGLVRYNRVEGISIGGRAGLDLGKLALDGTLRYGVAGKRVSAEIGIAPGVANPPFRLAAYDRVSAANPWARPLAFGNSFMALFFGRDDGEYFRAQGVELAGGSPSTALGAVQWRVYGERQRPLRRATNFSVKRWTDDDFTFRENIAAERADQLGAQLSLRMQYGNLPGSLRVSTELSVRGEAGTFDFVQPSATVTASVPLRPRLTAALEVAAGTTSGTAPVQSFWYLGGPATLRGFGGSALAGDSFWRGRAELGAGIPAARLALFSDVGWAGPRNLFLRPPDRPLVGAGVGLSLFDGLIRFDVSRAIQGGSGWRADFYFDAAL